MKNLRSYSRILRDRRSQRSRQISTLPASLKPVVSLIKQTQIAEITTELVSKNEITSKSPTFVNSASMVCHNLLTQAYQRRATGILKKDLTGTCLPRLWWTTLYQVCPFSLQGAHILRSTPTSYIVIYIEQFILHSTKGTGLFWVKQRW